MLSSISARPAQGRMPPFGPKVEPLVRTASVNDAQRCVQVLTMAFEDDPVCRWIWRDRQQYLESFPRFALAFAGGAIHLASAHYYGDFSGVAMWLPPGSHPDEESLLEVIDQTVFKERKDAMFSMFEQMEAHHPTEPHWYLPLIGVEPASQGRGIGSMLQRHVLDRCDDERVLAYLEATSPRNIVLYKRLGFEPIGRIQVADCPPVVPMLRTPR